MRITVNIPEIHFMNFPKEQLGEQLKLHSALLMFSVGQVSAGAACEIAGIDRFTLHQYCKQFQIPVINYGIEEIDDELSMLNDLGI